jgi:hypothetical protein
VEIQEDFHAIGIEDDEIDHDKWKCYIADQEREKAIRLIGLFLDILSIRELHECIEGS